MVPDGLWEIAEPLTPPSMVRPHGGGTPDTPDEALFDAVIHLLVSGCAWRVLRDREVDHPQPVRDLVQGRRVGLAARSHPAPPGRRRPARPVPRRARLLPTSEPKGKHTGPSPVVRGKLGPKAHVLSDANGLPLLVGLSAANTHHGLALKP
jgi:transposase